MHNDIKWNRTFLNLNTMNFKPPDVNPDIFDKYKKINRLIIIGNGFDIAHGLKTTFSDFISDYCFNAIHQFLNKKEYIDSLISINTNKSIRNLEKYLADLNRKDKLNELISFSEFSWLNFSWKSSFFQTIINEIQNKNWVDIEIQYFDHLKKIKIKKNPNDLIILNREFECIKAQFLAYLNKEMDKNNFSPNSALIDQFKQPIKSIETIPNTLKTDKQPDSYCILNFNYTNIAELYNKALNEENTTYIPIHGQLLGDNISTQGPIFGFGDEMDPKYVNFELYRNDDLFKYIKSFNYLQFSHYRNLMEFIDNDNFQVQIFGHSCGMSDRTLLNAVFEHENCISIKPFYYGVKESNDFEKKSYSISRHFKSKAELRIKVVNKEYCEAMVQPVKKETKLQLDNKINVEYTKIKYI